MPEHSNWLADRWHWLVGPWRTQSTQDELTLSVLRRIEHLERFMADTSPVLNKLAEDLRAWGAGPFAALLADNARLAARNAELEGEDVAESSAADNAVSAFNDLTAPVTESPDVPVEISPVEVPAAPPADEPTPPAA